MSENLENHEAPEVEEDLVLQCPKCGGDAPLMGQLGSRPHYRCRYCGWEFSSEDPD